MAQAKVSVQTLVLSIVGALAVGFVAGIGATELGRYFLEGLLGRERAAATANPASLSRPKFTLQYPSNWKIDTADKDYDPDSNFSIDSPGTAFAMFLLGSVVADPEAGLQGQIDAHSRVMSNPSIARFTAWGQYTGRGAILQGKIMGLPHTVKAFCFRHAGATVIMVQQHADEDARHVQPGFDLIERTFQLK